MDQNRERIHPAVREAQFQLSQRRISRREFLQFATLLGVTAPAAYALAACSAPPPAAAPATAIPPAAATAAPAPTSAPASGIARGGTLKVGTRILKVDHPARLSYIAPSNVLRHINEYLTITTSDNITHPWLLEKWEASDDVKTWDLYVRKGIKFSHGKDFTAEDVIFNFNQWFSDEVGSSMKSLLQGYLTPNDIEKVDDYHVRLNCTRPEIGVPAHLYAFQACILPSDFEGDWMKQPYGTGPFTLKEWVVEERAVIEKRPDYWRNGEDGQALPYLERIDHYDLGAERAPYVSALQSGQIDVISEPWVEDYLALKDDKAAAIQNAKTSQTALLRPRCDLEPWGNQKVRKALFLCQKRDVILKTALFGQADEAQDHHVAPCFPDYSPRPTPPYDPEQAKALLKEAGYPDGLEAELTCCSDYPEQVSFAETVKAGAEPAGFRINLKVLPGTEFWNSWMEYPFSVESWYHRPLPTMVLALLYTADEDGKPVAWNSTRWVDKEFQDTLDIASATLDVDERRKHMDKLEQIQQERGSVGTVYWNNNWAIASPKVQGYKAHPAKFDHFEAAWLKPA